MDLASLIRPEWPAHSRVRAFATTRASGDMAHEKEIPEGVVPGKPVWLRQVHGKRVIDADPRPHLPQADASVARATGTVCAVRMADCMPVLFSDADGTAVGAAHAGWRGLAAGVLEATLDAMGTPPGKMLAWLGPAIGPDAYEVGEDVRAAFAGYESAFAATRPGHWRLDLYAVARRRLEKKGVTQVYGGICCTYSDSKRFFSYRRDGARERMAALIWLA
jgi:polyphenol oxidase